MTTQIEFPPHAGFGANPVIEVMTQIKRVQDLDTTISNLQVEIDRMTAERREIVEAKIPDLMDSIGLSELHFKNGVSVFTSKVYAANISKARAAAAFSWLREHGNAAIIQRNAEVALPNEGAVPEQFINTVKDLHLNCEISESVNPQTLKKFVREKIEQGDTLPLDLFGVHIIQRAEIKKN